MKSSASKAAASTPLELYKAAKTLGERSAGIACKASSRHANPTRIPPTTNGRGHARQNIKVMTNSQQSGRSPSQVPSAVAISRGPDQKMRPRPMRQHSKALACFECHSNSCFAAKAGWSRALILCHRHYDTDARDQASASRPTRGSLDWRKHHQHEAQKSAYETELKYCGNSGLPSYHQRRLRSR
jgi:hypothetical protein